MVQFMRSMKTYIIGCIILVLFALNLEVNHAVHPVVNAHVMNDLSPNEVFTVNCKSNLVNLGFHDVEFNKEYNFLLVPNDFGTTLYECNVKFGDEKDWRRFSVYDQRRDLERCAANCRWKISDQRVLFGFDEVTGYWDYFRWL
ncbi:OLC1v1015525C1 [Oldenlandia corymbosa var. corymbosa]|uniref:S-protein homolog n=1 Tax=Oldenlandia corymbosa var. corymbosa TaxID=529605 RepID=A0AAV1E5P1_OLDCO|nr:OLC1v1015525C1 [Oldenlandia corymbosa var. corymbosa]